MRLQAKIMPSVQEAVAIVAISGASVSESLLKIELGVPFQRVPPADPSEHILADFEEKEYCRPVLLSGGKPGKGVGDLSACRYIRVIW